LIPTYQRENILIEWYFRGADISADKEGSAQERLGGRQGIKSRNDVVISDRKMWIVGDTI
jgi:hypothetical protein